VEAGGVKDVVQEMAEGLTRLGFPVEVVLPFYGVIKTRDLTIPDPLYRLSVPGIPYAVPVYSLKVRGVKIVLLGLEDFLNKQGVYTYTEEEAASLGRQKGEGYHDSFRMNWNFQLTALFYLKAYRSKAMVHLHDGHTALIPYLNHHTGNMRGVKFLLTLHNAGLAYRQCFSREEAQSCFSSLDIPLPQGGEELLDPFILSAPYGTLRTVSPYYAQEITQGKHEETTNFFGRKLEEHHITLKGITNGINIRKWDPSKPISTGIPFGYNWWDKRDNRHKNKEILIHRLQDKGKLNSLGLFGFWKNPELPIVTIQSRITEQKGIDIFLEALCLIRHNKFQANYLIMGHGEAPLEEAIIDATTNPCGEGRVIYLKGYNPFWLRLLLSASDFFLIPSRYEPCGLTDFMASLMGAVPIASKVGGLQKIRNKRTGFLFSPVTAKALASKMEECLNTYHKHPDKIQRIQRKGSHWVRRYYNWSRILRTQYLPLYKRLFYGP